MTSDGWVWWAVGLLVFSLALLFALSPAMLGDSSRFILTIRLAGLLGVTLLVTWIGVGRRRADAARNELLARERTARTEAEAASRSKEEFFATISHELRGPLNAIVGWVRLLRTGKLDEATAICALETVERNARSQAHLIGELLDVSHHHRGQGPPGRAPCRARDDNRRGCRIRAPGGGGEEYRGGDPARPRRRYRGGRSRPPAAGRGESVLERDQVHAEGRPGYGPPRV